MHRLAILTVSTSGARGQREDTGSQAIRAKLPPPDYREVSYEIVRRRRHRHPGTPLRLGRLRRG